MDLISSLPFEISQYILSFLDAQDVAKCSQVCKTWRTIANNNPCWRRLCEKRGWKKTDMVDDFRSHYAKKEEKCDSLEELCKWRVNFNRHALLPMRWETNNSLTYQLSVLESSVVCFHCDSTTLAVGHSNGVVSLFNVRGLPEHQANVHGLLSNYRVLRVKTNSSYVIILQSLLIQIFALKEDSWSLVDAKSFELGLAMVEVLERWNKVDDIEGIPNFEAWYKGHVGGDKFSRDWISSKGVFYDVDEHQLYVGVRDWQAVYVWDLATGRRLHTIHVPNPRCKMRELVVVEEGKKLVVVYASGSVRHITVFDSISRTWLFEVTTPETKTQNVLWDDGLLVGIGVSGPGLLHPGTLTVWDSSTGQLLSSRPVLTHVSFRTVVTTFQVVLYSEGSVIKVWEPRSDTLLKQFSTDENIVYMMPGPFRFLLVFSHTGCYVWDWMAGAKLYRVQAHLHWSGDYTDLVWTDSTMLMYKVQRDILCSLPPEITEKIIQYLELDDLLTCSKVSENWDSVVLNDPVWKRLCRKHGWNLNLLSLFKRDHLKFGGSDTFNSEGNPSPKLWREAYFLGRKLKDKWTSQQYHREVLKSMSSSPVYCLDSDGFKIVGGYEDGTISIWQLPLTSYSSCLLLLSQQSLIPRFPVLSVKLYQDYILVQQKGLLQIYKLRESHLTLLSVKYFDDESIEDEPIDTYSKTRVSSVLLKWQNKLVNSSRGYNIKTKLDCVTFDYYIFAHCGPKSNSVYSYSLLSEINNCNLLHLPNEERLRDISVTDDSLYITTKSDSLKLYKLSNCKRKFDYVPIAFENDVKKIFVTNKYILGSPQLNSNLLYVWDRRSCQILCTQLVDNGHFLIATTDCNKIMYSIDNNLKVLDPKEQKIVASLSTGNVPGFIRSSLSPFFITYANSCLILWNWESKQVTYYFTLELEWTGDFRQLFWNNQRVIVSGGCKRQIEIIVFHK